MLHIKSFVLVFVLTVAAIADAQHIVQFSQLPGKGFLIREGWKFHPGDNVKWAAPGFDDSSWTDFAPLKQPYFLPLEKGSPIGWLRVRVHVDSAFLHKPLVFQIDQHVARPTCISPSPCSARLCLVPLPLTVYSIAAR